VFLYREPFTRSQLVGFAMVWTALAVFSVDSLRAHGISRSAAELAG
jgi:chloramphenicol-sensitive protein RarD